MTAPWTIRVYEQHRLVYREECPGPVELGRQAEGEGKPYFSTFAGGRWRLVLARVDEDAVSRRHLSAEPLPDGRARLINESRKLPVRFSDGSELAPTVSCDVVLPVQLHIGHRTVSIEPADAAPAHLQSLAEVAAPPGGRAGQSLLATVAGSDGLPAEALIRWLQAAMDLLQSAASSLDFFDRAAGALVDMVGLDAGRVLLRDGDQWRVQARKTAAPDGHDWEPSRHVLGRVLEEKRTFWQEPPADVGSLSGVNALVAAPILDRRGEVIGALYGDRGPGGGTTATGPISHLEAMLVELLAGGVAAGLARLEQEQAAREGQTKLLLIERDLEIGRDIQAGFLPEQLPQVTGWEIAAYFRPAREVSGDFYDVFALPHDHLALVIADVCDKGVGAALYMTLLRSLLRAFAQQALGRVFFGWPEQSSTARAAGACQPRATLLADLTALSAVELTNNYVAQTHARAFMFATLFFAVLDAATGALTYVNAGHDAPVLLGPGGIKGRLATTGPVVGITPNIAYGINRTVLEPGDTLFAYTDGVTEARDRAGRFYTEKALLSLLAVPAPSVTALLDSVVTSVSQLTAGAEPSDDVTMLAVRRGVQA